MTGVAGVDRDVAKMAVVNRAVTWDDWAVAGGDRAVVGVDGVYRAVAALLKKKQDLIPALSGLHCPLQIDLESCPAEFNPA